MRARVSAGQGRFGRSRTRVSRKSATLARSALLLAGLSSCAAPAAFPAAEPLRAGQGGLGDAETLSRAIALPPPTHYRLENGLEVLLQVDRRQPRAALLLAYEIGSRDDPSGHAALAHLVEHMAFRGSRHLDALEGLELIESAGGEAYGASTSLDYSRFYSVVPASALPLALWVEAERMAFTLERFSLASLDVERRVVEQEELLRSNLFFDVFGHIVREGFGEEHPYSRPRSRLSDLRGLELQDVRGFFQAGYRPENARLIVVGDIDVGSLTALIQRQFGPIRNPPRRWSRAREAPLDSLRVRRMVYGAPVLRDELVTLWLAPAEASFSPVAARLFARVLARSLHERLVVEWGSCISVDAGFTDLDLAAFFQLQLELVDRGTHDQVEAEVDRVFAEVWRSDWQRSLVATQRSMMVNELLKLEDPLAFATRQLDSLRESGRPFDLADRLRAIGRIGPADMQRLQELFRPERALVVHVAAKYARPGASTEGRLWVQRDNGRWRER